MNPPLHSRYLILNPILNPHSNSKPTTTHPTTHLNRQVEIEGRVVDVYVLKRPHVDRFLAAVAERFEVVVFTASLGKYADPLLDLLDPAGTVRWRLFREACVPYEGSYVKDLRCVSGVVGVGVGVRDGVWRVELFIIIYSYPLI